LDQAAAALEYAMALMGERIYLIIVLGAGIVLPISLALFLLWSMIPAPHR
jgi:hypothetical protein